ncbi:calreticulin-like [Tachyglossus aculeatus]|uniref:calreticulin-like n=1 Tax=Tachyglossus aculeatus TaxID=9261 RepID=UPI0018F504D3|nr:calreticulin-like [Tachyglossus aculeatus]
MDRLRGPGPGPALLLLLLVLLARSCGSETRRVFLREQFTDGDGWKSRWVESKHSSDYGKFQLSAGSFYGDEEKDKGLQTTQDAKFYALSTRFQPFSNEGESLVVQFTVKHEQGIDCGGGYVKLFPAELDQRDMHSDSRYLIMFGPDICGTGNNYVHAILNYRGKYHANNKTIRCRINKLTHLYTLIIRPNSTYAVKIDNKLVESGSLEEDWDFLPPKRIKDPHARKPRKWDEREKIEDPNEKKPEDWEDFALIPDPEAKKPSDWDAEMDGKWEPPLIPNAKYKGEWKPQIIDNPNYKGEWVHPIIDNPKYKADAYIYRFHNISVLGLDLWQVKSGTIFDNFLLTNDEVFAEQFGNETWGETKEPEKQMKEKQDEEEKQRQQLEKDQKAKEEAEGAQEDEEEEEDEEGEWELVSEGNRGEATEPREGEEERGKQQEQGGEGPGEGKDEL